MPASLAARRDVSLLSHGYQYLTEQRYDQMEPVLEFIRRDMLALGLPLRSVEVEYGPSQLRIHLPSPPTDLMPADKHGAVSQCREADLPSAAAYHATFMCRPKIPQCRLVRLASASVHRVA